MVSFTKNPPENRGPVFTILVFSLLQTPQHKAANSDFPSHLVNRQTFLLAPSGQQFTESHFPYIADEIYLYKLNLLCHS